MILIARTISTARQLNTPVEFLGYSLSPPFFQPKNSLSRSLVSGATSARSECEAAADPAEVRLVSTARALQLAAEWASTSVVGGAS